jgi:hypothetical protein
MNTLLVILEQSKGCNKMAEIPVADKNRSSPWSQDPVNLLKSPGIERIRVRGMNPHRLPIR